MKKRFYVAVDIDTDKPGMTGLFIPRTPSPSLFEKAQAVEEPPVNYRINVREDPEGGPVYPMLAHEFGHLIGVVCDLPGWLGDPRKAYLQGSSLQQWYHERVMASEVEAWDMARLMLTLENARRSCLKTYEAPDWRIPAPPRL